MFLLDDATESRARLLLAHGAGAPMDHVWMNEMVALLLEQRVSVARFEFGFMADRRKTGKRRPAPRGEKLGPEYVAVVEALSREVDDELPLFIGGKSLGGRVASLVAEELFSGDQISGLVCFGYPFHPPKKPEALRTAHLKEFACPALVIQGTRDPLGNVQEVAGYGLDDRINIAWLEDGDHDLKPRKKSGETFDGHLATAADAVRTFVDDGFTGRV